MTSVSRNRAIVIGAGHSGLTAAQALKARGISVTILEARERIAEPWRSRHPQLRLNVHRRFVVLPGLPLADDDGPFLRRDSVVRYLERFAEFVDVPIAFGVTVQAVSQVAGGWHVETDRGSYACEQLIVATGREKTPHIPYWPGLGAFEGEVRHAADLGEIGRYAGRRILVVGAGNSGSDVLNHLSRIGTEQVWISLRHGPAILPTRLFGFPMHRLAKLFALLPAPVLDRMLALTQRLVFGDLASFGFRSHPAGGGTRLARDGISPALDDGFVAAVKRGDMRIVGEVVGFDRTCVHLADGTAIAPDVVICATGYRSGLEPLVGQLGVLDPEGRPILGLGESEPEAPRPVVHGLDSSAIMPADGRSG